MWGSHKIIVDGITTRYGGRIMVGDECPDFGGKISGIVVSGYLTDRFNSSKYRTISYQVDNKTVAPGREYVTSVMYHKEAQ